LNISIVTTAKTNEEGKELLKLMGMPFKNLTARWLQGESIGEDITQTKSKTETEVQRKGIQPMPHMRKTSGIHQKVRHLPNLLSQSGFPGQAPRCG
jgi:hypothetical protein